MKIQFNKVTWYSKLASIIFFVGIVPLLVFFIGREYQKTVAAYQAENEAAVRAGATALLYSKRESGTSTVMFNSGVKGVAMVGPTCPVSKKGSEIECADKPIATKIKFINQYGAATTTSSAKNGSFKISLAPGSYTIVQGSGDLLPALSETQVVVGEDEYVTVNLSFDSGIR